MVLKNRAERGESLQNLFRGDLDWVVMKCLEKDRRRRYETVNGLAGDLKRFLDNEPVAARPPSATYRLQKAFQRNRLAFSAAAFVVLALAVGLALAAAGWYQARKQRDQAQRQAYIAKMGLLQTAWEQNNVRRVRQLLTDTANYRDRGFEWYYWQRQTHLELKSLNGHSAPVICVAYSQDGQLVLTGSADHTAKIWDAERGKELKTLTGHRGQVMSAAFSPDGQRVVTGSTDHTVKLWNAATGTEILTLWGNPRAYVLVAFSPDGRRIVTVNNVAIVRDAFSGKPLFTLEHPNDEVHAIAFSADGRRIVTGSWGKTVIIWEAATGKKLSTFTKDVEDIISVAFSPDGERVLIASYGGKVKVWDTVSGNVTTTLTGHKIRIAAEISPDGRRIVTHSWDLGGGDSAANVWDAATGKELFTIKGPTTRINAMAFSPDGRRIITGCGEDSVHEHNAKIWDATETRETLKLETPRANCVVFTPDGQRVVVGIVDGTVKVCDATSGKELRTLQGHSNTVSTVACSHVGGRILTGSSDRTARVWDAATGETILVLTGFKDEVYTVAFSSDDRRIATGDVDGAVNIFESIHGGRISTLNGNGAPALALAFSPDDRRIVVTYHDGWVRVLDANSAKEVRSFKGHDSWIAWVAFSPDGKRFITGSGDHLAKVWDASTCTLLLTLEGHLSEVGGVGYSPDGRRIATAGEDGILKIWDADRGEELLSLRGRGRSVAFSPDGTRLATAWFDTLAWSEVSSNDTAKVWLAATPEQVDTWDKEEKAAAERSAREQQALKEAAEREVAERAQDPGAIKQWLVLEPIHLEYDKAEKAIAEEQIPNAGSLHPRAGEHTKVGTNELVWSAERLQDYVVDFRKIRQIKDNQNENIVGYALSYIESESDQTNLCARIGTWGCSKVFLNGKEIYQQNIWSEYFFDADLVTGIVLKRGLNVLVMKVTNGGTQHPVASIRFTDAEGRPIKGIKVTLAPDGP